MKTIHITSQDELPQVAGAIIGSLGRRTVVAFRGEMGAGKTTLIREIAAELGAADTVTSPTFAIVNVYRGPQPFAHFDMYRISTMEDLQATGFFDYLDDGAVVAAGAVVTADVPPDCVAAGCPAKIVKRADGQTRLKTMTVQGLRG